MNFFRNAPNNLYLALVIFFRPPYCRHEKQQGYTLIETVVAMSLIIILSATGLYGWQRWQQQQRLWQTACQVRDYLLQLRGDAHWHNRDHILRVVSEGGSWCFVSSVATQTSCTPSSPLCLRPTGVMSSLPISRRR